MAIDNKWWGIIYCPKDNALRLQKHWERIEGSLKANEVEYDYVQSKSSASMSRLIRMFINPGYKTIVIIGGDSVLNDTINCIMQADLQLRDEISLELILNGLMNDSAHSWNMREGKEERIIKAPRKHRVKELDLGRMRYTSKSDGVYRRYFLNCVSIGFIAVITNLRRKTRRLFGSRTLSFFFSSALLIFQRLGYKIHLEISTDIIRYEVMTVCVGSSLGYGQTPNTVPYNGQLDVSLVYHPEMTQLFERVCSFLWGKFLNHRSVYPCRTEEVEAFTTEHAMVGIDGRLMKTLVGKFTLSIEPETIDFSLPD